MNFEIEDCKTLNDICRKNNLKPVYANRQKIKRWFLNQGVDWKEWKLRFREVKYCLRCGKKLEGCQDKFCSRSCATSFNNRQREKENKRIKNEYCLNCGKKLSNSQHKFCSKSCVREYSYKQYIERWQNHEEDGIKGEYGISLCIRKYLFQKNENKCQQCGWSEKNPYTNNYPLEVHHIDGNYKNNNEENLQLLCPNCHSLTKNFKAANKNGRKSRKKYK